MPEIEFSIFIGCPLQVDKTLNFNLDARLALFIDQTAVNKKAQLLVVMHPRTVIFLQHSAFKDSSLFSLFSLSFPSMLLKTAN